MSPFFSMPECKYSQVDSSWTIHSLSDNDSKIYFNFAFYEENIHKQLVKKHIDQQSQAIFVDIFSQEKSTYSRRQCKWCANGVQVGDIEHVIV